ncbi:glycosyl transferase, group 1 family protein [Coleofasciculus chthonoplastes PCC 7420]|uniref:Glycosyl transferase, group 1 family protein n=1 Tax=Coleofasciculus chthonoplastes PCC 7420 TaxID=118168 RepID=B4VHA2_9CYAN|nr:glycosyltransferase family 4 protein [Coleofasciculus chthonoplastes]EDX78423.1 glycosyl transferase, group 1 family protein [Coleofasciculus chthonoplastes PCC 7420]
MSDQVPPWICCQLGAREHYAIPRALHQQGKLAHLITDAWVLPQSPLNLLPTHWLANLRDRFHPDLAQASVNAFTHSLIRFELAQRLQKTSGWTRLIARNHWFQQRAVELLETITPKLNARPILFAYSYAALELFRYAKTQGWQTILGQIDPGSVEETLVRQEHIRHPDYQSTWQPAPPEYWMNWQEECLLADRIIVNSPWSSQALQQVGIPVNKMNIIPLAYNPPETASNFERIYPSAFSAERPLRVLFLGQVILRKGVAALLEAAKLLQDQPIEFWLVGSLGIARSAKMYGKVQWIGSIPRRQTTQYYQRADVFLFPTLSDGFGLVQLEAQAWKLPIIASRFCGEVVNDRVNGLILPEVTGEAIALALEFCLNNPGQLQAFAEAASDMSEFSLSQLHHHLQSLPYAHL